MRHRHPRGMIFYPAPCHPFLCSMGPWHRAVIALLTGLEQKAQNLNQPFALSSSFVAPIIAKTVAHFWLGALVLLSPAFALQPDETLPDQGLERRAARLDMQLRCVVCEAQSIASSEVPLAQDMRKLVRRRVLAGDSDQQILAFMAARYGDEILLRPPIQANTLLLWAIPVVILGFMIGVAMRLMRHNLPISDISDRDVTSIDRSYTDKNDAGTGKAEMADRADAAISSGPADAPPRKGSSDI